MCGNADDGMVCASTNPVLVKPQEKKGFPVPARIPGDPYAPADGKAPIIFEVLGPIDSAEIAGIEVSVAEQFVTSTVILIRPRLGDCGDNRRSRVAVLWFVV